VYEADVRELREMEQHGQIKGVVQYATNDLEIMVPAGNPKGVQSLKDLGRGEILSKEERTMLETQVRQYTSPYCDVIRAKIVLLAAEGLSNDVIAARLDTPRQIVSKWRKRFALARFPGLQYVTVIPNKTT
jgi:DNA-binding transcriptional regulator YiaG